MGVYFWKDRCPTALEDFGRIEMERLQARIIGLPDFRCVERSRLPPRLRGCTRRYAAVAHVARFKPAFAGRPFTREPWLVEYNAAYPHVYNMHKMLYHELAHFICSSMVHSAPAHGLLWASCCDALMVLMEQDERGRDEGTDYLFCCSKTEQRRTLGAERITDEAEWRQARKFSASIVAVGMPEEGQSIHFDALREACMRATITGWELSTRAGIRSIFEGAATRDQPRNRQGSRTSPWTSKLLPSTQKMPASMAPEEPRPPSLPLLAQKRRR